MHRSLIDGETKGAIDAVQRGEECYYCTCPTYRFPFKPCTLENQ